MTVDLPSRKEALASKSKRYRGKICEKHLYLDGERFTSNGRCPHCLEEASERHYKNNIDLYRAKQRNNYWKNLDRRKEYAKEYNKNNLEAKRKYKQKYTELNREAVRDSKRRYYNENKDEINRKRRENRSKRVKQDADFRIQENLRSRLRKKIKRGCTSGESVRELGMSIAEFREYLASKFKPGMSWDNYGEWHIDHIKPLSIFNLQDESEVKKACHYSNLQPLWAKENILKSNKVDSIHAN